MALVEMKDVTRAYTSGDHELKALDGVNLSLEEGKFIVVLGPSGAGKSTLLNLLGGLDSPTSGTITVDGRDISKLSGDELAEYRAEKVGFVFQFYNLIPTLTVYENVALVKELSKNALDPAEMISAVGLADHMKNFPAELSGGEQQRVSIARAILKNPAILILDEATAAMDTQTERAIQESLNALTKNRTTIMIAHRLSTLRDADKLIVIENGKMPEAGTAEELLKKKGVYYKLYKMQAEALKTIGIEE